MKDINNLHFSKKLYVEQNTEVACNPNDANQLAVIGESVLRCLGCSDYTWRQFGYNKFDVVSYTSCCWLSQDRLMVGSNKGKIIILETGEVRAVFHAMDLPIINMNLKEEHQPGRFRFYTTSKISKRGRGRKGDRLIATCNETQIYQARLWIQQDGSGGGNESIMNEYGYPLHLGPIGSMSICKWKPICMTSGAKDRSLKIWNYETCDIELVQNFEDDIHSVALHPTGLYCVIGFSDKLRYMTIMIDDIITTKEFSIRGCKLSCFSRMGHFFASTNGNIIQVYSSVSFELMYVLKGHNGKIRCMSWSKDDRLLASCGSEGAVYVWDVCEAARLSETIIKSNPFTGVAITQCGKETYAVGEDGHVRELVNSNVHRDVVLVPPQAGLDVIVLSQLDTMLFITGNQGTVYSVKIPLLEKAEYNEFSMHKRKIAGMYLSYDDRCLITGAIDGSLCFWKLGNIEEKAIKLDKEISSSNEILISREILEDKMDQIKNLSLRLKELETEHSYQMRQNDAVHSLKMKDIHSEYCHAIEELKIKNEQMESDHIQELNNINSQIAKTKVDHELYIQKLEASYNEKLIVEYKKYMRFEEKMNRMLKEQEQQFEELKKSKTESEECITNNYLEIVKDKENALKEKVVKLVKEHEMIKQQIEDDCDREVYELKASHEKDIKEEQDLNVRLRGEAAVVKKKLLATQKESDDFKHQVYVLENEHIKFKSIINSLEKDIIDIKKEMTERDSTIEEKEKRIFQLKSKNQELEKFKFILDFKAFWNYHVCTCGFIWAKFKSPHLIASSLATLLEVVQSNSFEQTLTSKPLGPPSPGKRAEGPYSTTEALRSQPLSQGSPFFI
ncbi:hypothetical protein HUJ05_009751 [Dendroctonus ponderosae]|nr:hypothetical protein HUJ05_009751 [Dendroctonus ponderosae]